MSLSLNKGEKMNNMPEGCYVHYGHPDYDYDASKRVCCEFEIHEIGLYNNELLMDGFSWFSDPENREMTGHPEAEFHGISFGEIPRFGIERIEKSFKKLNSTINTLVDLSSEVDQMITWCGFSFRKTCIKCGKCQSEFFNERDMQILISIKEKREFVSIQREDDYSDSSFRIRNDDLTKYIGFVDDPMCKW